MMNPRRMLFSLLVVTSGFVEAQSAPPARTAKVETTEVKSLGENGKGPLRSGMEAVIAQCNGIRAQHNLPPKYPPSEMVEKLDIVEHVYAYDGVRRRALNMQTAHTMRLDDEERWAKEQGLGAPPDCSVATAIIDKSGTLWRDGKRYTLSWMTKKAIEQPPRPGDSAPRNLPQRLTMGAQEKTIASQMCTMQAVPSTIPMIAVPEQCLWRGFDTMGYLNLPLALSRTTKIGAGEGFVGHETATSAMADVPLDENLFEIPSGFTVMQSSGAHP